MNTFYMDLLFCNPHDMLQNQRYVTIRKKQCGLSFLDILSKVSIIWNMNNDCHLYGYTTVSIKQNKYNKF